MEQSLISKKDTLEYRLEILTFLWVNNVPKEIKLSLINKQYHIESLCNAIEH